MFFEEGLLKSFLGFYKGEMSMTRGDCTALDDEEFGDLTKLFADDKIVSN